MDKFKEGGSGSTRKEWQPRDPGKKSGNKGEEVPGANDTMADNLDLVLQQQLNDKLKKASGPTDEKPDAKVATGHDVTVSDAAIGSEGEKKENAAKDLFSQTSIPGTPSTSVAAGGTGPSGTTIVSGDTVKDSGKIAEKSAGNTDEKGQEKDTAKALPSAAIPVAQTATATTLDDKLKGFSTRMDEKEKRKKSISSAPPETSLAVTTASGETPSIPVDKSMAPAVSGEGKPVQSAESPAPSTLKKLDETREGSVVATVQPPVSQGKYFKDSTATTKSAEALAEKKADMAQMADRFSDLARIQSTTTDSQDAPTATTATTALAEPVVPSAGKAVVAPESEAKSVAAPSVVAAPESEAKSVAAPSVVVAPKSEEKPVSDTMASPDSVTTTPPSDQVEPPPLPKKDAFVAAAEKERVLKMIRDAATKKMDEGFDLRAMREKQEANLEARETGSAATEASLAAPSAAFSIEEDVTTTTPIDESPAAAPVVASDSAPVVQQDEAPAASVSEEGPKWTSGGLVPPTPRTTSTGQRGKMDPLPSAAQTRVNEAFLRQLKGQPQPVDGGSSPDATAETAQAGQSQKKTGTRRRSSQAGATEIPVETLGLGIYNALGDMVGGAVHTFQKVSGKKRTLVNPTPPETDGLPTSTPFSGTDRAAKTMAKGVTGVVGGVGGILQGGVNLVVGTVGVVTMPIAGTVGAIFRAFKQEPKAGPDQE
ncbi:MAG: hypothetical protein HQL76_15235 [Magnetococcales bacterium]|nr:hypothetical protein [Magnetococcales bacterium]